MEEHYGVINRASRLGRSALSPPTRQKLEAECPGVESILGAHQFLEHYPDVSAFALNIIADTLGSKKLASGKYYSVLNVQGERVVVLNAFHPQQLLHYTRPGQTLVVFECWSDTDWQALRHEHDGRHRSRPRRRGLDTPHVAGKEPRARPRRGHDGDQRRALLCRAVRGMLEYCRFFSDHGGKTLIRMSATPFGQMLQERGLKQKDIAALAKNPLLGEGKCCGLRLQPDGRQKLRRCRQSPGQRDA